MSPLGRALSKKFSISSLPPAVVSPEQRSSAGLLGAMESRRHRDRVGGGAGYIGRNRDDDARREADAALREADAALAKKEKETANKVRRSLGRSQRERNISFALGSAGKSGFHARPIGSDDEQTDDEDSEEEETAGERFRRLHRGEKYRPFNLDSGDASLSSYVRVRAEGITASGTAPGAGAADSEGSEGSEGSGGSEDGGGGVGGAVRGEGGSAGEDGSGSAGESGREGGGGENSEEKETPRSVISMVNSMRHAAGIDLTPVVCVPHSRAVVMEQPINDKLVSEVVNPSDLIEQRVFNFENVFDAAASQEDVYRTVRPLIESVVEGFNATIFAYGSTGSGKTFTLTGTEDCPGIFPRAVQDIFTMLADAKRRQDTLHPTCTPMTTEVRLSIVELYNGDLRDLLHRSAIARAGSRRRVRAATSTRGLGHVGMGSSIRSMGSSGMGGNWGGAEEGPDAMPDGDDGKVVLKEGASGVQMTGSSTLRTLVASVGEAMTCFRAAVLARAQTSTNLNEHSSRSHAIYTFDIHRRTGDSTRHGKLHVIDLAGSERTGLSGVEGAAMTEANNINASLTVLGVVLSALSKRHQHMSSGSGSGAGAGAAPPGQGEEGSFIPFRRSKLTLLLKDSLGGNSRTLMMACVREGASFAMQSRQTLMYALRVQAIQNCAKMNVEGFDPEVEARKAWDAREVEIAASLRIVEAHQRAEGDLGLEAALRELARLQRLTEEQCGVDGARVADVRRREASILFLQGHLDAADTALEAALLVARGGAGRRVDSIRLAACMRLRAKIVGARGDVGGAQIVLEEAAGVARARWAQDCRRARARIARRKREAAEDAEDAAAAAAMQGESSEAKDGGRSPPIKRSVGEGVCVCEAE